MDSKISEVLRDLKTTKKLKEKLPKLFYLSELESLRAGKIGMEVVLCQLNKQQ